MLQDPSQPLVVGAALKRIYESTSKEGKSPQPHASIELLKKCIQRTSDASLSKAQEDLIDISGNLRSSYIRLLAISEEEKGGEDIIRLEAQEIKLKQRVAKEKSEIDVLHRSKHLFHRVTQELLNTVKKVSQIGQEPLSLADKEKLNQFVLLQEFLRKALEKHIREKSEQLGVKSIIDKALVEEVLR